MNSLKGMLALAIAMPSLAPAASPVEIRRNTVLEVTADDDLSVRSAREGDRFSVTVSNDRDLPRGTQLMGEIMQIREKSGKEPASMDLEFNSLILPNGERHRIQAIPIALDNKHVRRDRDGRFYADAKTVKNEYYVLGGLLGGLVIGALIKKPFEGAFIGTLAGIIFGEAERSKAKGSDYVLKKGTKLGAVVLEDIRFDYNDRDWNYDRERNRDWDREQYNDDRYRNVDRFDIRYQNRALRFESKEAPYAVGRSIMVPLRSAARQLGLQMDRTGERIFVENDDHVMRLTVGERAFRFDGTRRGDLPAALEEKDGVVYAPLEALVPLLSQRLIANGMEVRSPA